MEPQHIIDILAGLVIAAMGFFIRNLHEKTERTAENLSTFKEYVALNHPINDSIDKRFDKLETKIDRILDKMDQK